MAKTKHKTSKGKAKDDNGNMVEKEYTNCNIVSVWAVDNKKSSGAKVEIDGNDDF